MRSDGIDESLTVGLQRLAVGAVLTVFVATRSESLLRRVLIVTCLSLGFDLHAQSIFSVAGGGTDDGRPATVASLFADGVALDAAGNLYIADSFNNRIRKVAAGSGIISTVAGNGSPEYSGDGGPATAAGVSPSAAAVDGSGNLYIADRSSLSGFIGSSLGRIRAVFACVTVNPAGLLSPADGSSGVATSPRLTWDAVQGAFRYDVRLDTVNPPLKVAAEDVTVLSLSPANLDPLTTYYWQVIAKGDPFCTPPSKASSEVRSFTTTSSCRRPPEPEGVSP